MTEQEGKDFVLTRCPPLPDKPRQGVSADRLALEKQVADMLPPELVEWLPRATSAAPDERGSIESFNNLGGMVSFFGSDGLLDRISPPSVIEGVRKWLKSWLGRRWLPIASDGCGDYFLLIEHVPGRRIVVFWDQRNNCDEYDYVYASSLWHFLAGALSKPHEQWPCNRWATLAFDPDMGELKGVRFGWSGSTPDDRG
jgi:hypothetical protein